MRGKYSKVKVKSEESIEKAFCKQYRCSHEDYWKYKTAISCECCGIVFGEPKTRYSKCQDHDHNTGQIRGVICSDCNTAEGRLATVNRAKALVEYMNKWQS